jgi:hypothetical protein
LRVPFLLQDAGPRLSPIFDRGACLPPNCTRNWSRWSPFSSTLRLQR